MYDETMFKNMIMSAEIEIKNAGCGVSTMIKMCTCPGLFV